jgi:hypothetical protein
MDPGGHEFRLRHCTSSAAVGEIATDTPRGPYRGLCAVSALQDFASLPAVREGSGESLPTVEQIYGGVALSLIRSSTDDVPPSGGEVISGVVLVGRSTAVCV